MEPDVRISSAKVADKSAPTPPRGHHALRRWRVSVSGRTYFITACTYDRQELFGSRIAADLVFQHLHALDADSRMIELLASVVMSNHVHAIFTLRDDACLEAAMKHFRGSSAQAINRALGRTGPVWQRAYFDRLLRLNDRLETVIHYLWNNPTPPGKNFRCRRELWDWFRTCVTDHPVYYDWLKLNP
jgi:putative transposase